MTRPFVLLLLLLATSARADDRGGSRTYAFTAGVHSGGYFETRGGALWAIRTSNSHDPTRWIARTETESDGTVRVFDRDDLLAATYHVRDGELDGALSLFDREGHLALEASLRGGVLDGSWREWTYERGEKVEAVTATFVAGELDGEVTYDDRFRDERGTLHFRAGKPDGTWIERGPDTSTVKTYKAGAVDGPAEITRGGWTERGTLVGEMKEGVWERSQDGVLVARETYVHGILDGPATELRGAWAGSTFTYRNGMPHGWLEVWLDGRQARERWAGGHVVEIVPRRPSYAWDPWGVEVAGGPMWGKHVTADTRFDLTHAWGRADSSRDGTRARGGYVATGGEATMVLGDGDDMDGGFDGAIDAAFGPVAEVGWAAADYDRDSAMRGSRIYARAVPFATTSGGVGGRIAIGLTIASWPGRAWSHTIGSFGKDPDCYDRSCEQDKLLLDALAVPFVFPTAPLWLLNHFELTAEADTERGARLGFMVGYGR